MGSEIESAALVDEAMKRSGLVWLSWSDPPRTRAFWHAWLGGRIYLLTGPGEQPDPRWRDGERVKVIVRSKDNLHRLVVLAAHAGRVERRDDDWQEATSKLASSRLNLADALAAPARWAGDTRTAIYRLTPEPGLLAGPAAHPDGPGRAVPVSTPATTAAERRRLALKRRTKGRSR